MLNLNLLLNLIKELIDSLKTAFRKKEIKEIQDAAKKSLEKKDTRIIEEALGGKPSPVDRFKYTKLRTRKKENKS